MVAVDVFVGRVRELAELERVLEATRAGSGSKVLITGEAGIGKTRLASELGRRARDAGFEVMLGRSMDLAGVELPYQPYVDALRRSGQSLGLDARSPGSQLAVFEGALALLDERAAAAPVLLILEDLHWADPSTLDLVVFLAHHLQDRRVMLLGTCRADEPSAADRIHRLVDGVRRSGAGLALDLGPLRGDELAELLASHEDAPLPEELIDTIIVRSEGNPFFAEELLAAAGQLNGQLPPGLRNLLLRRVTGLDAATQSLLRLVAAAGHDVAYAVLLASTPMPEGDLRESLRQVVERGLLVPEQVGGTFRFRHALLAEAVYETILPGEREELHARLAEELARSPVTPTAELARHWTIAGRPGEALAASIEAADQAEAVFGRAEALAHLERVLVLWDAVPDARRLARSGLAELCARAAELASQVGEGQRAVDLAKRAIELAGPDDRRAAFLHVRLGEYLFETCREEAGLVELERAVAMAPPEPPSAERAYALGSLAGGLMVARRYADSLPIAERALSLAREVGAGPAEVRALTVLGTDLAYLGRGEEGLARLRQALGLAEEIGDHWGLDRVYVNLTDTLTMMGRPRESARLGLAGLEVLRRHGIESALVATNTVEAMLAVGDWSEADRLSDRALRSISDSFRSALHLYRAGLDLARGEVRTARDHLDAARPGARLRQFRGLYDILLAELALCEHRWPDADRAVRDALDIVRPAQADHLRVWFCAVGLRAQADLAGLARAHRDADAIQRSADRSAELISEARESAAAASAMTPNAAAWLAVAEAEHLRAGGPERPESWSAAAAGCDRVELAPLAAYCRRHEAEALVAAGASRTEAAGPLRRAYAVATRLGARPLVREIESLAQRTRIRLEATDRPAVREVRTVEDVLGLTAREAEVLDLVSRGCTNREIAATLVISVKTANVHVSHILRKLGVSSRLEAAAIAHRLATPHRRN